jgi:3-hydroxyacyl-[acyl-carrier-protein] dehydratase
MQLDFEAIKKLIPQRFPFLMIDRVIDLEPGKRAVAIKNVSGNDILFLGHFPDKAVLPGAAILEAMAQTAIVLFAADRRPPEGAFARYYFGSVKARFLRAVVPGDQLRIEMESAKTLPMGAYVSGAAYVEGRKVTEADLVFSVKHE